VKAVEAVIAESAYCKQEFMGRANEVSYKPSLPPAKGNKLTSLGSEISGKGNKDYQDYATEIAHFFEPRWRDTP